MTSLASQQITPALVQSRPIPAAAGAQDNHTLLCSLILLAADTLALATALFLAAFIAALAQHGLAVLASPFGAPVRSGLVPAHIFVPFLAVITYFYKKGRYSERTPFWAETGLVICVGVCAAAAEMMLGLMYPAASDGALLAWALLAFTVLAPVASWLSKRAMTVAGVWLLPVLVIGEGPSATHSKQALESDRSLGFHFVGRIAPAGWLAGLAMDTGVPRLWPLLHRYRARRLLIALDEDTLMQRQIVECALRERVPFAVVMAPHQLPAFGCTATRILSHNAVFLSFRERMTSRLLRLVKTAFDVIIAGAALVVLAPLLLGLAIACRIDGGPSFFAHRRVGANGRLFRCFKFRTMVVDADRVLRESLARSPALAAEWAVSQKLTQDPRVTHVGQFLRKTSLDELPQLLNVLRLEMSLVGPRPIVESEVPLYGEYIAHYYAVRPGLTGLWQVSGRNDTSYQRRVQLDVWYVNNWSIWYDIAVLLKTIPAVLRHQGAY